MTGASMPASPPCPSIAVPLPFFRRVEVRFWQWRVLRFENRLYPPLLGEKLTEFVCWCFKAAAFGPLLNRPPPTPAG
jgi:hypothetical protein